MNDIYFMPQRQAMTVSPDYDDATGEFLGFDARPNQPFAEEIEDISVEDEVMLIQEDPDDPDYADLPIEMAELQEEIFTADFAIDPDISEAILGIDHDAGSEADLVQHLISEVYLGNLTREEALDYAASSPYDPLELMLAFKTFQDLLNE